MRLALACALLLSTVLLPPAAGAQPGAPLPIPVPPNTRLQVELDARDQDLLGSVKTFLRGLNVAAFIAMMSSAAPGAPVPRLGAPGTPPSGPFGGPGFPGSGFGRPANLADILKDIHHLHLLAFESSQTPDEMQRFYEEPFLKEGGRRTLLLDLGAARLLAIGFDEPRGFAAVLIAGKEVVAGRADGYPDLEQIGPILMSVAGMATLQQAAPSAPLLPSIAIAPIPTPAPKPAPKPTPRMRRPLRRR